jgi:hypothetical protein
MMSASTPDPQTETQPPSTLMRQLAIIMLILPAFGLVIHAAMLITIWTTESTPDWMLSYIKGYGIKLSVILAGINLLGNWFHYRHTRMPLDVLSRILTYLWILSLVLILKAVLSF